MAESAWGSAEELLHPRDSHGRFRSKWKMSMAAVKRTMARLDAFSPRMFQNDQEAGIHVQGLAGKKKNLALDNYLRNSAKINADLRKGEGSDTSQVKAVEAAMQPLQDDLILNRVVGPEAFGLKPENLANLEEYTGKLVADKGFGSANVGTPLAGNSPSITLVIAAPKGTRVAVPRSQGSREVILDREQPLRITKVQPDGKGGFYVMAVAMEKGSTGNLRTKKLGTRAPRPTEATPDVAVSPDTPAVTPQAPAAPVRTGKPGRPAGPPPPPRTEPHVADSIGGGPAPETKSPEVQAPESTPTAESPTPEPKKVVSPSKGAPNPTAETSTTPPAAPEPAPISTKEADQLQREQNRRQRAEVRAARFEGAEEERKKAQARARADQKRVDEEHDRRAREGQEARLTEILAKVGETELPKDEMLKAFIGVKMSQAQRKSRSKKSVAADFREAAGNQKSPTAKRILNKLADSLEPPKAAPKMTKASPGAPQAPVLETGTLKEVGLQKSLQGKFLTPEGQKILDGLPESGHSSLAAIEDPQTKMEAAIKMLLPKGDSDSYVSIADVRKLIGNQLSKEEFDRTAVSIATSGNGDMAPQENVRPDESVLKANSVRMGGADKDLIWVDTSHVDEDVASLKEQAQAKPTPEPAKRLTPSMAVGKTNTSRVQTGDKVLVKKNAKGEWVPSTTKTGATTITVSKKQPISYKGRGSSRITGTDENGNEITVVDGPGIQTYWLADQTAAGKKATKAAAPPPKTTPTKATPSSPPKAEGALKMSDKPLLGNNWGSGGGEIEFHPDGIIGDGIRSLGDEKKLSFEGEPLANVLGKLATDVTRGKEKTKNLTPRLRVIAQRLPEGSKAKRIVERMAKEVSPPAIAEPKIPDTSPEPIKRLRAELIDNPLTRVSFGNDRKREPERLAELMRKWELGQITPLGLENGIREFLGTRHESSEGMHELVRSVNEALKGLEALRKKDRDLLRPPQLRGKK